MLILDTGGTWLWRGLFSLCPWLERLLLTGGAWTGGIRLTSGGLGFELVVYKGLG